MHFSTTSGVGLPSIVSGRNPDKRKWGIRKEGGRTLLQGCSLSFLGSGQRRKQILGRRNSPLSNHMGLEGRQGMHSSPLHARQNKELPCHWPRRRRLVDGTWQLSMSPVNSDAGQWGQESECYIRCVALHNQSFLTWSWCIYIERPVGYGVMLQGVSTANVLAWCSISVWTFPWSCLLSLTMSFSQKIFVFLWENFLKNLSHQML